MTEKQAKFTSSWLSEASHTSIIADKARRAETFLRALADGKIDESEIEAQQQRLVALMEEIEPQLEPTLHDKVTHLLCELTVYDLMQATYAIQQARPKVVFRG